MIKRAFGSLALLASTSSVGQTAPVTTPVAQSGEPTRPEKEYRRQETSESKEWFIADLKPSLGSTSTSDGIPLLSRTSGSASLLPEVQEGYRGQYAEQRSEYPVDEREPVGVRSMLSTPEAIHYSSESAKDSETFDSGTEEMADAVAGEPDLLAFFPPAIQQRRKTYSSDQGNQRNGSSPEVVFPTATESGQLRVVVSSAPNAVEARCFMLPLKSTHGSVWEQFLHIERLHREEKDHIITHMTAEHEGYKRFSQEQFEAFRSENESLRQEISTSTSRITMLENRLKPLVGRAGAPSQPDKVDFNIIIITNTIATVATRIEELEHTVSRGKGQLTVSSEEMEQLFLDLSRTSSQMTDLQQHFAELLRDINSIRHELQVTSSQSYEKDRTIASLSIEVAECQRAQNAPDRAEPQDHCSSHGDTATTGTAAEERVTGTDAREVEQFSTSGEGITKQAGDKPTFSSETPFGRQECESQPSGTQRNVRGTPPLTISDSEEVVQHPTTFSPLEIVETQRARAPTKYAYSVVRERFVQIREQFIEMRQHVSRAQEQPLRIRDQVLQLDRQHREERDRMVSLMTNEHEEYKRSCEERLEVFRKENERLLRDYSAATSRITLLEAQLDSRSDDHAGITPRHDQVGSDLTTFTTSITTITTQIEKWRNAAVRNRGRANVSSEELDQLWSYSSNTSSKISELQQHHSDLSRDASSVLHELQVASSLCDGRGRIIESLNTKISHLKIENAMKAQQIAATEHQNETLRRDLASAFSQAVGLQYSNAQSSAPAAAHNEVEIKASLAEEKNVTISSPTTQEAAGRRKLDATNVGQSPVAPRGHEKRRVGLPAFIQPADLHTSHDAQSEEVCRVRSELSANRLVGEKGRVIVTLTDEVDQLKRVDCSKAEQFTAKHRNKEKVHRDLLAFSAQIADLQKRFDEHMVSVRNELHAEATLLEDKELTVSPLSTEVAPEKRKGSVEAEGIDSARNEIEELRRQLSSASSRMADLEKRHEEQSKELNTALDEIHQIHILHSDETNDAPDEPSKHTILQLINRTLGKKDRLIGELRRDLDASNTRNTDLLRSYEELSRGVSAANDEPKTKTSESESTIPSPAAQVDQWKLADTAKAERIIVSPITEVDQKKHGDVNEVDRVANARKQVEKLQQDLSISASELADLQERYQTRSRELTSVRNDLEDKNRAVAALIDQVEGWKGVDARKEESILTIREEAKGFRCQIAELQRLYDTHSKELTAQFAESKRSDAAKAEQLRRDLATLSSAYESQSAEFASQIERWKRSDAIKTAELTAAHNEMEELRRDLSSQIIKLQERFAAQATHLGELTSQMERCKRAYGAKAEELVTAYVKLEQFQNDLSTSSSRIIEFEQRCEMQSTELSTLNEQLRVASIAGEQTVNRLNAEIERLKVADGAKAEEVARSRREVEQLQRRLSALSSEIEKVQRPRAEQPDAHRKPHLASEEPGRTDEAPAKGHRENGKLQQDPSRRQSNPDGTQHSITRSDPLAEKAISQLLEELNTELTQSPALIAERFVEDFRSRTLQPTEEQNSAAQRVSNCIGQTLAGYLERRERNNMVTFLQIAFQAYIAYYLRSLISSLIVRKGYHNLTHEQLEKSEAQMISGLSDIIVTASCATSPSAAQLKLQTQFRSGVSSIVSIAGQLSKMIGEFALASFEILGARPSQPFEGTTMEEDTKYHYESKTVATAQKVLCLTQLGMTKRVTVELGKTDALVIIKAKVVLFPG